MKFSTRTTYGLRAIVYLAKQKPGELTSLAQIAAQEKISLKYLENIFGLLKKGKLVRAVKGPAGGYALAKPAPSLTVYELVVALEKDIALLRCLRPDGRTNCRLSGQCAATKVLARVQAALAAALKTMSLRDLL